MGRVAHNRLLDRMRRSPPRYPVQGADSGSDLQSGDTVNRLVDHRVSYTM